MNKDVELLLAPLKKWRQDLHQIPELGHSEYKTTAYLKEALTDLGIDYESVLETGIVALIKGSEGKRTIAFRADIDGLPVMEPQGSTFRSKHEGYMHACGHDGHMSALLAWAKYLKDHQEDLIDNVLLVFQPAEEGPGGAKPMIDTGIFEKYPVDAMFGFHVFPQLEEGIIGLKSGALMAQPGEFDITITAKGGHGAEPHNCIDGILVASHLVQAYQSIISRNVNPIESGVVTVGKIEGGFRRNVIAESVKLEGTIRAFEPEVYTMIKTRMLEINQGISSMFNVDIKMEIRDLYLAVMNDEALTEQFMDANGEYVEIVKPQMISEDYSFFQREFPGIFVFVGVKNEDMGYDKLLHNEGFMFREEALLYGIQAYVNVMKHMDSLR